MRTHVMLATIFVCLSLALISEAIIFNDNMFLNMMMMNQFSQSLFGGGEGSQSGMPLMMMAGGNDNMKRLMQGLLFSRMLAGGGAAPAAVAAAPAKG